MGRVRILARPIFTRIYEAHCRAGNATIPMARDKSRAIGYHSITAKAATHIVATITKTDIGGYTLHTKSPPNLESHTLRRISGDSTIAYGAVAAKPTVP